MESHCGSNGFSVNLATCGVVVQEMERPKCHHDTVDQPRSYQSCMPVHIDKGVYVLAQAPAEAARHFKVIASSNSHRKLNERYCIATGYRQAGATPGERFGCMFFCGVGREGGGGRGGIALKIHKIILSGRG